jgi:hypothetical protein
MASFKLLTKLREGESVIGILDEVEDGMAHFSAQDGGRIRLPLDENLARLLDDSEYIDEIVKLTKSHGAFEVEVLRDWPAKS